MKLVLYSGGEWENSELLNRQMLELSGRRRPKITFVPSCSLNGPFFFKEFEAYFKRYSPKKIVYFPMDVELGPKSIKEAFDSEVMYLSGGNTFHFLKYVKKFGYLQKLKDYVKRGGVLGGLSAGAILMTPNINTAGIPTFDRDDNDAGLRNLKALGLTSFEFFPHYTASKRYDRELLRYSRTSAHPIFAAPDGTGIVRNGKQVTTVGKGVIFYEGKKLVWPAVSGDI